MSDVGLTGMAAVEAEMRDRLQAKNAEIERLQGLFKQSGDVIERLQSQLAEARKAAIQECIDIAAANDDCGGDFITQRLRDLALTGETGK